MSSTTTTKKNTYNVVLVGEAGTGKSCLTIRFIADRWVQEYDPTLEDSYSTELLIDDKKQAMDIYDTAGTEDFAMVRAQYIREAEGVICVYSINNKKSYEQVTKLHDHVLRVKDGPVPFVLVGTKGDLENEREVTYDQGKDLSKTFGKDILFFETSAKTGKNVKEAFTAIGRLIKKQRSTVPEEETAEVLPVKETKKKKKGICTIL